MSDKNAGLEILFFSVVGGLIVYEIIRVAKNKPEKKEEKKEEKTDEEKKQDSDYVEPLPLPKNKKQLTDEQLWDFYVNNSVKIKDAKKYTGNVTYIQPWNTPYDLPDDLLYAERIILHGMSYEEFLWFKYLGLGFYNLWDPSYKTNALQSRVRSIEGSIRDNKGSFYEYDISDAISEVTEKLSTWKLRSKFSTYNQNLFDTELDKKQFMNEYNAYAVTENETVLHHFKKRADLYNEVQLTMDEELLIYFEDELLEKAHLISKLLNIGVVKVLLTYNVNLTTYSYV